MPVALAPGEDLVGRPDLRPPTAEEARRLEAARPVLATIPPFPGGDAGHLHPDYATLFRLGLGGLRRDVATRLERAPADRQPFYRACETSLAGLAAWIVRVADACDAAADGADGDAPFWRGHADRCRRLAVAPPETFHDALQLLFLTLVALWFAEDHGLTTPGRLDRTLRPFYDADVAAGRPTPGRAFELLAGLLEGPAPTAFARLARA